MRKIKLIALSLTAFLAVNANALNLGVNTGDMVLSKVPKI